MDRVRVLIADNHSLFAEALDAILGTDPRFEIVALANDGRAAVDLAGTHRPDVVLMDISMSMLDGFAATKEVRELVPETSVLMLTGSNARGDVDRARKSGAPATSRRIASQAS